jgi:hypothetical protein
MFFGFFETSARFKVAVFRNRLAIEGAFRNCGVFTPDVIQRYA